MPTLEKILSGSRASIARAWLLIALVSLTLPSPGYSQQKQKPAQAVVAPPALTRTTTRHEVRRLGYGSGITLLGPPAGSITIEGWNKNEVDITADIELSGNTLEDLALLAQVNTFVVDEEPDQLRIISTGTHDKKTMKRAAKGFPKRLLGLPWKIDYKIRVPAMCDLDIHAGRGPINLSGVEGAITVKALESDTLLTLTGGVVMATVGSGSVTLNLPARSWRGRGAEIRLALGKVTLELPPGFSSEINADVLRTGQIDNAYPDLAPRERTTATPRSLKGRAGAGGAVLSLTVGDGTITIKESGN